MHVRLTRQRSDARGAEHEHALARPSGRTLERVVE
jgi:hypothetical protein